jgi:hypothetical protein
MRRSILLSITIVAAMAACGSSSGAPPAAAPASTTAPTAPTTTQAVSTTPSEKTPSAIVLPESLGTALTREVPGEAAQNGINQVRSVLGKDGSCSSLVDIAMPSNLDGGVFYKGAPSGFGVVKQYTGSTTEAIAAISNTEASKLAACGQVYLRAAQDPDSTCTAAAPGSLEKSSARSAWASWSCTLPKFSLEINVDVVTLAVGRSWIVFRSNDLADTDITAAAQLLAGLVTKSAA